MRSRTTLSSRCDIQ